MSLPDKIAWSVADAAKATSTSANFIRKAIAGKVKGKPKLRSLHVGRRVLVLDKDLREWLETETSPRNDEAGRQDA